MTISPLISKADTSRTAASTPNAAAPISPGQSLDQADFLKLLVTQMQSQNPLDPQTDTAFAAQLAQFSALQQSQNMSQNMAALQANSLIGETVSVAPLDGSAPVSGTVAGVIMQAGVPVLVVNGQTYNLGQVTSIQPPDLTQPTNTTTTTNTPTTDPTTIPTPTPTPTPTPVTVPSPTPIAK